MDDRETGIAGAARDLLKKAEGLEQSAVNGSALYLDRAAFETITGFYDHPEGGKRLYASLYPTISCSVRQVLTATILEQIFEIEFLVQYAQCPDCTRLAAKNTWKALVQVRQKVPHKRTFLFLEQLILKHGAQKDTISVKEVRDGLDFFYSQKSHAVKMTEFLTGSVPVRWVYTMLVLTDVKFYCFGVDRKLRNSYYPPTLIPTLPTSSIPSP